MEKHCIGLCCLVFKGTLPLSTEVLITKKEDFHAKDSLFGITSSRPIPTAHSHVQTGGGSGGGRGDSKSRKFLQRATVKGTICMGNFLYKSLGKSFSRRRIRIKNFLGKML